MNDINAYPLSWPAGRERTTFRQRAPFHIGGHPLTVADAVRRLLPELQRLGAREFIVSTNIRPRLDGMPSASEPTSGIDPGAAVYFLLGKGSGTPHALACDKWTRVADNLAAIARHVEAIRGMIRWGVGDALQMMAGFRALPAMDAGRPWWEVLAVKPDAPPEEIKRRYRELLHEHHPDKTGDARGNLAAEITAAYRAAEEEGRVPA